MNGCSGGFGVNTVDMNGCVPEPRRIQVWSLTAEMTNVSKRTLILALTPTLALALAGCGGDHPPQPGVYSATPLAQLAQTAFSESQPVEYHLNANDAISIQVYGEPDISTTRVTIDQSGIVNVNFVGGVHAAGLTCKQLSELLNQKLLGSLRTPQVSVNLVEYGSQKITVEGSVMHAGIFELQPGTTLLGAVASAGGVDRMARVREVAIFRTDETGRTVALFDLHAIRSGKMIDPVLKTNDRVVIGVSGSKQLYQDLLQVLPVAGLFTRF